MKRTCTRPLCALLAFLLFLPSCGVHEADTSVSYIRACGDVPATKEMLFTRYSDIVVVAVTKTKEKYHRKNDEYSYLQMCIRDSYCSLDCITVGTHEMHPTVDQCTDCKSFELRK